MAMTITDVNDGTVYTVNKTDVAAIYDLTDYRIVRLITNVQIDVTESFATLVSDVAGGPPVGP